jgi:hypothetical protein
VAAVDGTDGDRRINLTHPALESSGHTADLQAGWRPRKTTQNKT